MITSLLIANRGEIACRIIRTARAMGVRTVAVYSDADAKALHVRQADEAVHIGASPARESYLVGEKIIAAAKATGAEAIHPGYGFLSENADFAQAVIDAGLIWVGPNPDSIRAMGLKDAAKARMIAAGVPVTPGYLGQDQNPATLKAEADKIGFPILIKAVAGGGGKGMRRVEAAAEFDDALDSCKREAASSFGDDRVILEKYILSPRHIEVQVFGDSHGNLVHLFERDCSLQRRHQKVIEEAPAPGMDVATREAICGAAVKAARAVNYVGAGTIEFIADASEGLRADRIWFMEMNTRLQVEHCVTEEITGVDLVEWQLRVASGEKLPKRQDELSISGHAIEARLYAEDPAKGFLPSVGKLEYLQLCDELRVETGVEEGDDVSPFYDPMIAKLIASAPDRETALKKLIKGCRDVECWPVKTNALFLARSLSFGSFVDGAMTTGTVAAELESLAAPLPITTEMTQNAALQTLYYVAHDRHLNSLFGQGLRGFRVSATRDDRLRVLVNGAPVEVGYPLENEHEVSWTCGRNFIERGDTTVWFKDGSYFTSSQWRVDGNAHGYLSDGAILAPMPGRVTAVEVAAGDVVTKGQRLLTLEAMKMEHSLTAPFDGVVAELNTVAGAQVQVDAVLVRVTAAEAP